MAIDLVDVIGFNSRIQCGGILTEQPGGAGLVAAGKTLNKALARNVQPTEITVPATPGGAAIIINVQKFCR